jgi:hypothetical protein
MQVKKLLKLTTNLHKPTLLEHLPYHSIKIILNLKDSLRQRLN